MGKTVQPWLDYLLDEIRKDRDPALSTNSKTFNETAEKYKNNELTEEEVRTILGELKERILPQCQVPHHTEKLLSAAIEYIIKPDRKLQI